MSTQTISTSKNESVIMSKHNPPFAVLAVLIIALSAIWWWLLRNNNNNSNSVHSAAELQSSSKPIIQNTTISNFQTSTDSVAQIATVPMATLKLETELHSITFQPGSVDISPEDKAALGEKVKAERFFDAAKIHLQGRSGNTRVDAEERRRLAFGRAWSVKQVLVNDFNIEPAKIRLFIFTMDHHNKPSVKIKTFNTIEASAEDAKNRLTRKNVLNNKTDGSVQSQ